MNERNPYITILQAKKGFRLAGTFFIIASILFGAVPVSAQTAPAYRYNWRDRQSESPWNGQDQQQISDWRGSSATQSSIAQLSSTSVQELFVPILFGVALKDIFANFGDPRSGGRTHEGEDILAPRGSPIISPTDAVVLKVGTGDSSGFYVYTANPGGETFVYMHLDSMSPLVAGTVLKTGDLIGYVGNTGNASGGVTHLHFEIRKNGATDPFPRLKRDLTPAEKMQYVNAMIIKASDKVMLANTLVQANTKEFLNAKTANISLAPEISQALDRYAASVASQIGTADLSIGSQNANVTALQNFLIIQNKGSAATALGAAGATGYFGAMTKGALVEYQQVIGIAPATGIYDTATRNYIQTGSLPLRTTPVPPVTAPSATSTNTQVPGTALLTPVFPVRDLTMNSSGGDVVWLQAYLIAQHSGPAADALLKAGATGYFGSITRAAVIEFQAKAGITPAAGYFGTLSRAYAAAHPTK